MSHQVCFITGPTSGLGRAIALELAERGNYQLVLLARNAKKLAQLSQECIDKGSPKPIELICDMESQAQVRQAAEDFLKLNLPLHILINNAGVVYQERKITEDGLEGTMAISYWSAFLLTMLLLPTLEQSKPAQIINTISNSYTMGKVNFDDFNMDNGYLFIKAYANTKLQVVYWTREMARRLKDSNIRINMYTPGMVYTGLASNNDSLISKIGDFFFKVFSTHSMATGISAPLALITDPQWQDKHDLVFWNGKKTHQLKPIALDETISQKLWQLTEEKTNTQWPLKDC